MTSSGLKKGPHMIVSHGCSSTKFPKHCFLLYEGPTGCLNFQTSPNWSSAFLNMGRRHRVARRLHPPNPTSTPVLRRCNFYRFFRTVLWSTKLKGPSGVSTDKPLSIASILNYHQVGFSQSPPIDRSTRFCISPPLHQRCLQLHCNLTSTVY